MRVSKEVMEANNARIVTEAARIIREKGIEATSVAEVMAAAGLTHGGFYRHFASKEELVCAAIKKAFNELVNELEKAIERQGAKPAIGDFVQKYLSEHHVANPGIGCPIAALSGEIDRKLGVYQKEIDRGAGHLITLFTQGIDGEVSEKGRKATGLLAVLVGTLVLARSARTKSRMKEILVSGRQLAEL